MQLPHVMALGLEMQCNCVSDPALLSVYYTHSMPLISFPEIQHVAPLDLVKPRVILVGVTRGLWVWVVLLIWRCTCVRRAGKGRGADISRHQAPANH